MGKQERRGDKLVRTQTERLREKGFEGNIPPLSHDEWNGIRKTLNDHDYLKIDPKVTAERIKKDIPAAAKRTERESRRKALLENMKSGLYGGVGRAAAAGAEALTELIQIGVRKAEKQQEIKEYQENLTSDIKYHPRWEGYNKKRRLDKHGRSPYYEDKK